MLNMVTLARFVWIPVIDADLVFGNSDFHTKKMP